MGLYGLQARDGAVRRMAVEGVECGENLGLESLGGGGGAVAGWWRSQRPDIKHEAALRRLAKQIVRRLHANLRAGIGRQGEWGTHRFKVRRQGTVSARALRASPCRRRTPPSA